MMDATQGNAISSALEVLKANGYAILKPFTPLDDYSGGNAPSVSPDEMKVLMVLDFEATGIDPHADIPIEIGFVLVEYDPNSGTLHRVLDRYSGLEDPGVPLSPEITKVTGLTDDDVRGQHFDDDRVERATQRADLMIAHNASYDRVMGERRFPSMSKKNWACSMQEGPWDEMAIGSKKQEFLAFKVAGMHYGAHRAEADCEVLLHILSSPGLDGKTCFSTVLDKARELTYTVWAERSPFESKDVLKKEGGYRWSGDDPSKIKSTWYKDGLRETQLTDQLGFLLEKVYKRPVSVTVDSVGAMDRYSVRHTKREVCSIKPLAPGGVSSAQLADPSLGSPAVSAATALTEAAKDTSQPSTSRRLGFSRR